MQKYLGRKGDHTEENYFPLLASLSRLRCLELELGNHPASTSDIAPWWEPIRAELTMLTRISVHASALSQRAASFLYSTLTNMPRLEFLKLRVDDITNASALRLADSCRNLRSLRSLSLTGWDVLEPEGAGHILDAMKNFTDLTRLNLAGAFSGELSYKHLTRNTLPGLTCLKKLVLEGCELRDASVMDIATALELLTSIEDLQVRVHWPGLI